MNRTISIDETRYPQITDYVKSIDKRELSYLAIKLLELSMVLDEKGVDLATLTSLIKNYELDNISLTMAIDSIFGKDTSKVGALKKKKRKSIDSVKEMIRNSIEEPEEEIEEEEPEETPEETFKASPLPSPVEEQIEETPSYMPEIFPTEESPIKPKRPSITNLSVNLADIR